MTLETELQHAASRLVAALERVDVKIVLAESCTSGRAAAGLGLISGVSRFFCGSFVVYRPTAKAGWLGLSTDWLAEVSTESLACSEALALAALDRTSEASFALAVTGDLDPSAGADKAGKIYLAAAGRPSLSAPSSILGSQAERLVSECRGDRQTEAAKVLLAWGHDFVA